MNTTFAVAFDIAGVLSLVSLATFLTACVWLILRDSSDAARHGAVARTESAKRSTPTVGIPFLFF